MSIQLRWQNQRRKDGNFVGVKNFVNSTWGYPRNHRIIELGPNLFQFYIPNTDDREGILGGGPWTMDNQLPVIKRWFEGIEESTTADSLMGSSLEFAYALDNKGSREKNWNNLA